MERGVCSKQVLDKGEDKYADYDTDLAIQTYDIIGKHISQFKRPEPQSIHGTDGDIPECFMLLVNYFET
jgi:hypothetical protein